MPLIAAASAHGSPGVTTALSLLVGNWPGRALPVLFEADANGGTLAARFELSQSPGLAGLVDGLRHGDRPDILDHAQALPSGAPVVVAPASASISSSQLRASGTDLADFVSTCPLPVVADLGQMTDQSASLPLALAADVLVWFVRPIREELRLLHGRIREMPLQSAAGIVLVGSSPYGEAQVNEAFDLPVVHVFPFDRKGARAALLGGADATLRKSELNRSVKSFASKTLDMVGLEMREVPQKSSLISRILGDREGRQASGGGRETKKTRSSRRKKKLEEETPGQPIVGDDQGDATAAEAVGTEGST